MNKFCPFYKNKSVFDSFNELIQAFGGQPMTEEEFESADLRMQRSGLDLSAVEAAYRVYEQNEGNFLDYASNGQPSILFNQILALVNYDRAKAIRIKSKIYSKEFLEKDSERFEKDINGEPILPQVDYRIKTSTNRELLDKFGLSKKFKPSQILEAFGEKVGNELLSGHTVSSKDVIKSFLQQRFFSNINESLAQIIQRHDVPIRFEMHEDGIFAKAIFDKDGGSYISIDPSVIPTLSNRYVADVILHEMIHSLTVSTIKNPIGKIQKDFAKSNNRLYEIFDKLFPASTYNRLDLNNPYYALLDKYEFASVFITDKKVRNLFYQEAIRQTKKGNNIIEYVKKFINSISRFFVNKNVFNSLEDDLKLYEKNIKSYLLNIPTIDKGNITNSQLLDLVYSQINSISLQGDQADIMRTQLAFYSDGLEQHNFVNQKPITVSTDSVDSEEQAKKKIQSSSIKIANMLTLRLAATMASNMSDEYKLQQKQSLEAQIQQFKSDQISLFIAVQNLLSQLMPQLLSDSIKLRNISESNSTTSDKIYRYQMHDNFGVYEKILDELNNLIENSPTVRDILMRDSQSDPLASENSVVKSLEDIRNTIKTCFSLVKSGKGSLQNIMINNLKRDFQSIGNTVHMPSMIDYLSSDFSDIGFDTSWFFKSFGSVDRAKDDGLRTLAYLVNTALNKADRLTHDRSVELMQLQENLSFGESVSDLYELDDKGRSTGYLNRRFKYGLLFSDFREFKKKLNADISREFGILLDPRNNVAPQDNEEARKEWERRKLDWLDKHCYRKYTREYYEAYNNLSEITRVAKNDIQSLISSIKSKVFRDGFYHYEDLSDEDWDRLKTLYIQKRQLASDYDINGDLKTGEQLTIARELQALNKFLSDHKKYATQNTRAWEEARKAVFISCGGIIQEENGKIEWQYPEEFDWDRFNKWDSRNSKRILKQDKDGNVLLFKKIDQETAQMPTYEVDGDGGAKYEEIKEKINKLLSPYRDVSTGDILATKLPKAIKVKIKKLEQELRKIQHKAVRNAKSGKTNPLKVAAKQRKEIFEKYAESVDTELYKQLKKLAQQRDLFEPGYYDDFISSTGRQILDVFTGEEMGFRPYRWFTKIVAKPEYEEEFMDVVPGDGWINTNEDEYNELLDPHFKEFESEGMTMIPRTDVLNGRYDNSKAYRKITEATDTLLPLYEAIHSTIKECNTIYKGEGYHDDYLLPQITGSYFDRVLNSSSFWGATWSYIKDGIGINTQSVSQSDEFGQNIDTIFDKIDEFGQMLAGNSDRSDALASGKRPDGTPLNMIPQYYTRLLDDPSQISKDLCGITCEYYKQALRFKYKSQIQDTAETVVDMMYQRKHHVGIVRKTKDVVSGKNNARSSYRTGADSNTYQTARKFLDMNLYNIRSNDSTSTFNGFSYDFKNKKWSRPEITIHWNKLGMLFRAMTVAINLGMNVAVAGTGFFTALFSHWVQACSGQHYGLYEASYAGFEVAYRFIFPNLMGTKYISKKNSTDKLMVIMEHYDVANQLSKKLEHTNRNRMFNVVNNNWCFGALTGLDFIIKSQIAVSTLMSFRLYDGHFTTEEDLRINNYNIDSETYKNIRRQWKDGVNLYSVLKVVDGKLTVDEAYKKYFEEIEPIVHARIQKYTEAADGMATETQKAAITTSFMGAAILMHRQYFPLMLQERFGEQVWDPDTQQWTGGVYRGAIQDIFGLGQALFFGIFDNFRLQQNVLESERGIKNRLKKWYRGDTSSTTAYQRSRLNRHQLRQVASEIAIYNVVVKGVVALLTMIASKYKDKDKWDYRLIMLLLYIAHRTQWETFTPYRLDDALNTFKSVSATTGTLDKAQAVWDSFTKWIFPRMTLFDTLFSLAGNKQSANEYNPSVQQGVYSDNNLFDIGYWNGEWGKHPWTKVQRDLFKITPMHNLYEQWYGSDQKDRYYVNQIMQEKK